MDRFDFVANLGDDIIVRYNDQYLFRQNWNNVLSFAENLSSAAAAAERITIEMSEAGKIAAAAGKRLVRQAEIYRKAHHEHVQEAERRWDEAYNEVRGKTRYDIQ